MQPDTVLGGLVLGGVVAVGIYVHAKQFTETSRGHHAGGELSCCDAKLHANAIIALHQLQNVVTVCTSEFCIEIPYLSFFVRWLGIARRM